MVEIIDKSQAYFYQGELEKGTQLFTEDKEGYKEVTLSSYSVAKVGKRYFLLKCIEPEKFLFNRLEDNKLKFFYKSGNSIIVKDDTGEFEREEIPLHKGMTVVTPEGQEGTVLEFNNELVAVQTPFAQKAYYIKDLKTSHPSINQTEQYLKAIDLYEEIKPLIKSAIIQENTNFFKSMAGEKEEEKLAKETLKPQPLDTPKIDAPKVDVPKVKEQTGLIGKIKSVFTPKTPIIHPTNFVGKQPALEHNFKNKLDLTLNKPKTNTFDVATAKPEHFKKILGVDSPDYSRLAYYNPSMASDFLQRDMEKLYKTPEAISSRFKEAGYDYVKHYNALHNPDSGNTHDVYSATHLESKTNPISKEENPTEIEQPTYINKPSHFDTAPIHLSAEQLAKNKELKDKGGSVVHKLTHVDLNPNSMGDEDKYLFYYKRPNGQITESTKLLDAYGTEATPDIKNKYIQNVIGNKLFIPGETVSHNGKNYQVVSHVGGTKEVRDLNKIMVKDENGNQFSVPKNEVQPITDFTNSSKVTLDNGQQKYLYQLKAGDTIQGEDGMKYKVGTDYTPGRGVLIHSPSTYSSIYHPESEINNEFLTGKYPQLNRGELISFQHAGKRVVARVDHIDKPNKQVFINMSPYAETGNTENLASIPLDFATNKKEVKHIKQAPLKYASKIERKTANAKHKEATGIPTSEEISEETKNQINHSFPETKPAMHKFENFKNKEEATQKLLEVNDKLQSLIEGDKNYSNNEDYKKLSQQRDELNDIVKQHTEKEAKAKQTKEEEFGRHAQNYKEFVDNLSNITNEPHERSDVHSVHKTGIGDLELKTEHDTGGNIKITPSSSESVNGKPIVKYKNSKGQTSHYFIDSVEKDPFGNRVMVKYHDKDGKRPNQEGKNGKDGQELSAFKQHISEQEYLGSQQKQNDKPKKKNVLQKIEEQKEKDNQLANSIKEKIQPSEPPPNTPTVPKEDNAKTKEEKFEPVKSSEEYPLAENYDVRSVPITHINGDEKRFQNRDEDYSPASVKKIVDDVEKNGGKFDKKKYQPIVLWTDPKDKKHYILSGHSRYEAFKQLADKGYKEFNNLPTIFAEGSTEKEAKEFATRYSNYLTDPEHLFDTAKQLRAMRGEGKTEKEIQDESKRMVGKNGTYAYELSHLSPNGSIVSALKQFKTSGDKNQNQLLEKIASFAGYAKNTHQGKLTDAHEEDMLNHLLTNHKKYNGKTAFAEKVGELTEHPNYDQSKKLQFDTGGYNTDQEKEWKKKYDALNVEGKRLEQRLKDKKEEYAKRATTESGWTEEHTNKANTELDKVRTSISDIEKQKAKLKTEFGKYSQADKEQSGLFKSESAITMPMQDFVDEHNNLSNILISGSPSDRLKEAREQFQELKKKSKTTHIASVAVMDKDNNILMGRRKDSNLFTLPGGHLEGKEVPVEGAIRELQEETGLETSMNKLKYLGSDEVLSPEKKKLTIHAFLLKIDDTPTTTKEDPDAEVKRWNWIKTPLSEDVLNNLHSKKNVTLKLLGLQKWGQTE